MRPLAVAALLTIAVTACTPGAADRADPADRAGVEVPSTAPETTTSPTAAPTTMPPETTTSTTAPPPEMPMDDGTLRPGEAGDEVLVLQTRLRDLGYWLGEPDSSYGGLTSQAVMAFQKANGLGRDGVAGPATLAALEGAGRPIPASTADGIEIDLERQVLLVVRGGQVEWAINTSTGRSGWRTPTGTFTIERQIDGVRRAPLGDLYRPKYFNVGIAVHGSPSVPANPASHGCARVTNAAIDMLWASGLAEVGTEVRVY